MGEPARKIEPAEEMALRRPTAAPRGRIVRLPAAGLPLTESFTEEERWLLRVLMDCYCC